MQHLKQLQGASDLLDRPAGDHGEPADWNETRVVSHGI
jgi:hypothetical protein